MFRLLFIGFVSCVAASMIIYALATSDLTLNEIKIASIEKVVSSMMDDLDRAMPLIEKAGYTMSAVEAELRLPPELKTIFQRKEVVEKGKQELILKALENNRIGHLVLQMLMQTFSFDEKVAIKDMKLEMIHIVISFPPYVVAEYTK